MKKSIRAWCMAVVLLAGMLLPMGAGATVDVAGSIQDLVVYKLGKNNMSLTVANRLMSRSRVTVDGAAFQNVYYVEGKSGDELKLVFGLESDEKIKAVFGAYAAKPASQNILRAPASGAVKASEQGSITNGGSKITCGKGRVNTGSGEYNGAIMVTLKFTNTAKIDKYAAYIVTLSDGTNSRQLTVVTRCYALEPDDTVPDIDEDEDHYINAELVMKEYSFQNGRDVGVKVPGGSGTGVIGNASWTMPYTNAQATHVLAEMVGMEGADEMDSPWWINQMKGLSLEQQRAYILMGNMEAHFPTQEGAPPPPHAPVSNGQLAGLQMHSLNWLRAERDMPPVEDLFGSDAEWIQVNSTQSLEVADRLSIQVAGNLGFVPMSFGDQPQIDADDQFQFGKLSYVGAAPLLPENYLDILRQE